MRTAIHLIIIAVLAAATVGCTAKQEAESEPQPDDTLYSEDAALRVYAFDPEQALAIIDSAVMVGNLDEERAAMLRVHVYSHNITNPRLDTAWHICDALIESNSAKNPSFREAVLDHLGIRCRV